MKAAFYTLGCKVNQYESEYMAELLRSAGFEIVPPDQEADYYIVNSCTVTATADQKTRQSVRRFKRRHPGATVILTGCMPQAFPEEAKAQLDADIVFSNKSDGDIFSIINRYHTEKSRIVDINAHQTGDPFAPCAISGFGQRVRAFVKIEDGCDRFCSYCIIPKSRGRVCSKAPADLEKEVQDLAAHGIKEIVLVGINLSAYGKGQDFDLLDAVAICDRTPGIARVRLGSLEPDHITDRMIAGLAKIEKFCPQFHISLQSGCTKTLKSMNRHYTADEYADLCRKLRAAFPGATLTTDMMSGFHEETEADFEESLAFAKKIGFEKVHVFPYSQREGTAASKRGDSVPRQEKERRAKKLIAETDKLREAYFDGLVGQKAQVLVEQQQSNGTYTGYTRNYVPVTIHRRDLHIGDLVDVTITGVENADHCIAE